MFEVIKQRGVRAADLGDTLRKCRHVRPTGRDGRLRAALFPTAELWTQPKRLSVHHAGPTAEGWCALTTELCAATRRADSSHNVDELNRRDAAQKKLDPQINTYSVTSVIEGSRKEGRPN